MSATATPAGRATPKTTPTTTTTSPEGERRIIPAAGPKPASRVTAPVPDAQRCQALADDYEQCLRWFAARIKIHGKQVRVCAQHQTCAARGTLVLIKPAPKATAGAGA